MNVDNGKAHIVKHINHPHPVILPLTVVAILCGAAWLLFHDSLELAPNRWFDLTSIFLIVAGAVGLIFGLLNCKKTWCDTHQQEIICKPLLGASIKIPFSEVYKIKAWPKAKNKGADTQTTHEDLLHIALTKVKFIGKDGIFITVEKTDKFNHVIYNFFGKVPLEVN